MLTQGPDAVRRYIRECREVGFDIVEVSSGFISIPTDDFLRLVAEVQAAGMKAKPEVGIQFGAGAPVRPPNCKPKERATHSGPSTWPAVAWRRALTSL
jgi:phosphosulfolactate synthase (CoM biosynthesis protein A)